MREGWITLRTFTERVIDAADPLRAALLANLKPMEATMDDSYLIWSNEHRAWWAPDGHGYVKGLWKAGRYTKEQALAICRNAMGTSAQMGIFAELPVREDDVLQFAAGTLMGSELL